MLRRRQIGLSDAHARRTFYYCVAERSSTSNAPCSMASFVTCQRRRSCRLGPVDILSSRIFAENRHSGCEERYVDSGCDWRYVDSRQPSSDSHPHRESQRGCDIRDIHCLARGCRKGQSRSARLSLSVRSSPGRRNSRAWRRCWPLSRSNLENATLPSDSRSRRVGTEIQVTGGHRIPGIYPRTAPRAWRGVASRHSETMLAVG